MQLGAVTARGCEKTGCSPRRAACEPCEQRSCAGGAWYSPRFFTAPRGAVQTRPNHPAPEATFSRGVGHRRLTPAARSLVARLWRLWGGFLCGMGACTASFGRGSAWGWVDGSTGFRSLTELSVRGSGRFLVRPLALGARSGNGLRNDVLAQQQGWLPDSPSAGAGPQGKRPKCLTAGVTSKYRPSRVSLIMRAVLRQTAVGR